MWKIKYSKRFLKELSHIPQKYRSKIEKIVFEKIYESNPFSMNIIQRLKGHDNRYKIRVGPYRIGLKIVKDKKEVIVIIVAHRKDIYKIFP